MRILIFARGGIGDVLMATPMFRAIKQKYPDSFLAVGVNGKTAQKLLSTNKRIDLLFIITKSEFSRIFGLIKFLRFLKKMRFEYCFLNHSSGGRLFTILPFFAGIKNRIGFNRKYISKKKGHAFVSKFLTRTYLYVYGDKKRTEKNLELLEILDIKNHDYSYELPISEITKEKKKITIGIHPGSDEKNKIKRWDIKKFNSFAKKIIDNFDFQIRFYIGPQERELTKFINNSKNISIVEKKSIQELIYSLAECDYFISNDSGLSHLAAALKVPIIAIYGPTSKYEYILPTKHINIEKNYLDCRPCIYSKKECKVGKRCLEEISVKDVWEGFEKLLCVKNN